MIGLTLSGGGVNGSYQIGAFMAFKECGIKFDGITGTSIGAFNGAVLASNMESELLDFWLNVDVGRLLGFNQKYLDKVKNKQIDLEYFLLKFDNFVDILKNQGVSIDGLQRVLEDFGLEDKIRKSKIIYGLSTLRLKDNKPLNLFLEDIPYGSLNNYILASCYLPIFKREKLEDDSYFFDGGIHNYCPVNMLLDKGFKKVYAIDLKAIGISEIVKDKSKVVYLRPSRKLSSMISLDQEAIKENIRMGYYDTLKYLKGYDGNEYIFKKKSKLYYKLITSKVSKKTLALASGFFGTSSKKELVIRSLEYILKKDQQTYYQIYKVNELIRKYQNHDSKAIAIRFISELLKF
ncbi:MAG: patatin-like phospholipase family protein [Firmicutes bacterium]|nr:patatin-like phospholipase family protein [Bacillota bacterium]